MADRDDTGPAQDAGPADRDGGSTACNDVAVVGMACKLPGADDYHEYWRNLRDGICSISEIPADRWDWHAFDGDQAAEGRRSVSRWGGFIRHPDRFEPEFFGISPREAAWMDPQQRMVLELSWQCIEDAGYRPAQLSGAPVGVYVGVSTIDYKTLQQRHCHRVDGHTAAGTAGAVIPNRVSYLLNLRGPSLAVDTACSSSLVALQQAVAALRAGDCEAALVGGVALIATPDHHLSLGAGGMLSPTGACKTFDAAADGYVRAEGAGMVMLKPLRQALAAGDRVWGVIKGVAVNHGGRARSLTAPNALAQSQVIARALRQAKVDPQSVTYVETHGTGTPLGDPIEVHGLERAFKSATDTPAQARRTGFCALGAAKTHIGHLEAAAGIAGLIKVLLAMRHRQIPGNVHFSALNSRIDLEGSPFYIASRLSDWTPPPGPDGRPLPRRAGVSSFGFGGANCHVVLEEAGTTGTEAGAQSRAEGSVPWVLALSARHAASLRQLAQRHVQCLEQQGADAESICSQASALWSGHPLRLAVAGGSAAALAAGLRARLAAAAPEAQPKGAGAQPKVGFLFTGQGSQYLGMGRTLLQHEPVFRAAFDDCERLMAPHLGGPIRAVMHGSDAALLGSTRYTQPALFALQYSLARMWAAHGLQPAAVMGHSVGEVAAACVAGMLSLADAIHLICTRGELMQSACQEGSMAAVLAPADRVLAAVDTLKGRVDIAALNGPASSVISGPRPHVEQACRLLDAAGIDSRPLPVDRAFHSALMEPMQKAFGQALAGIAFRPPELPLISNVTGAPISGSQVGAGYWVEHVRKPVLFQQGVQAMRQLGVTVFLELGPASTLIHLARHSVPDEAAWLASLDPDGRDAERLAQNLVQLHELGVNLDFAARRSGPRRVRVDLPAYPFSGDRHWLPLDREAPLGSAQATGLLGLRQDMAGTDDAYFAGQVEPSVPPHQMLADHRLHDEPLMPGAGFACLAAQALQAVQAVQAGEDACVELSGVQFVRTLALQPGVRYQTRLRGQAGQGTRPFEIWSRAAPEGAGEAPPWVLHAQGDAAVGGVLDRLSEPPRAQATTPLDVAAFYDKWAALGLHYGPAFRGITQLGLGRDASVAEVCLPDTAGAGDSLPWHPALLDAIWQTGLPLLEDDLLARHLLPLPVAVDRIVGRARWPRAVRVVATRVAAPGAGRDCAMDFSVWSLDGAPVARIDALRIRPSLHAGLPRASAGGQGPLHLLEPRWVGEAAPDRGGSTADTTTASGTNVLVCTGASHLLVQALKATPALAHAAVLQIGVQDPPLPGASAWQGSDEAALETLLAPLPPIRRVFFIAQSPRDAAAPATPEALAMQQQPSVLALLHLVRVLQRLGGASGPADLVVVGDRVHAVGSDEPGRPWTAGLFGLAGVYGNENRSVRVLGVDLDLSPNQGAVDWAGAARQVLQEAAPGAGASLVAWRAGRRYERVLRPVVTTGAAAAPYRPRGVYVLVGGAGGIGLALAERLAERFQARLLLIGRRPVDAAIQAHLDKLSALGAEARYVPADARDPAALCEALAGAVAQWGGLDGVVHTALQLGDSALANMDEARFRATHDAKVLGSMALHQAIQRVQPPGRSLDFLVFFSSAVSFLPNRGQANYVAGCMFQDAYARYLHSAEGVPARVINWGRWEQVGAAADAHHAARLGAQGVQGIAPAEGLDALDACLAGPARQVVAIKAGADVLQAMGMEPSVQLGWVPGTTGPWPRTLAAGANWSAATLAAAEVPDGATLGRGYAGLNQLALRHVRRALHELQGDEPLVGTLGLDEVQSRLRVLPAHRKCLRAMLNMLVREGLAEAREQAWVFARPPAPEADAAGLGRDERQLLRACPWLEPELRLLRQCGPALAAVMRGDLAATRVLFPDLSMDQVEAVYRQGPMARACNDHLARQVASAVAELAAQAPTRPIRIVEVGAGTGATSAQVLAHLSRLPAAVRERLQYLYTDISPAFLQHGRDRFAADAPFAAFQLLDIEAPLRPQGYEAGCCDLLVASNVLDATRTLARTLQQVKFLLARGGMLLVHEALLPQDFLTATFGLLEGWWLAEDAHRRLPDSPLLSEPLWRAALGEAGFSAVHCTRLDAGTHAAQGVITAVSDGCYEEPLAAAAPRQEAAATPAGRSAAKPAPGGDAAAAAEQLASASTVDLQSGVAAYLLAELGEVLMLAPDQAARLGKPVGEVFLSELGMDSLTALDLRNRLRARLGLDLSVEMLLGGARVQSLIDAIVECLLVRRLVEDRSPGAPEDGAAGEAAVTETFTL
ncbi:MAG TPA: SAM-dependent methyltransferase [Burkholderiaceae bacterium]|nr:SAM-dependent methyltransferase [Burkholderiaceae bacterium]